jgi:hypothetical protein
VNKAQLSKSVVDDTNVTRLFSSRELEGLFRLENTDLIPEEERQEYAPKLVSRLRSSPVPVVLLELRLLYNPTLCEDFQLPMSLFACKFLSFI